MKDIYYDDFEDIKELTFLTLEEYEKERNKR
jgi:hypothetical protein